MNIYAISLAVATLFLITILELVRRGKLKEQYSLIWLGFGFLFMIVSVNPRLTETFSRWLGVHYAPALLFLAGLLCCFALILHLTVIVSRQSVQLLRLTQELTLLKGQYSQGDKYE